MNGLIGYLINYREHVAECEGIVLLLQAPHLPTGTLISHNNYSHNLHFIAVLAHNMSACVVHIVSFDATRSFVVL